MQKDTLLFIGTGIIFGALILSLPVGIFVASKDENAGFRYGALFLGCSAVFLPGLTAGMICLYYEFLKAPLAHVVGIPSGCAIVAILLAYKLLKFKGVPLFLLVNLGYIITIYFSPIVIWNLVYYFYVAKPHKKAVPPPLVAA